MTAKTKPSANSSKVRIATGKAKAQTREKVKGGAKVVVKGGRIPRNPRGPKAGKVVIVGGSKTKPAVMRTNLAALDSRTPEPDEDTPELTLRDLKGAYLEQGGKKIGRPKAGLTKVGVFIRLSAPVVQYFKSDGPGWQTRIDGALLKLVKEHD